MRRIVSVWLPHWPIERSRRLKPDAVPAETPLALVAAGRHGIMISAVNTAAAAEGVRPGTALADARAALPHLLSRPAEPARDRAALLKLARWTGRYGPARNADPLPARDATPDAHQDHGLWIDASGVAHLFGGEERLLADLVRRLAGFSVTARAALAGTYGAAHALARFAPSRSPIVVPPGGERAALAPLPVAALRLDGATSLLLGRLGLKRIGQLYDLPRAALERRFRSELSTRNSARTSAAFSGAVVARLDQALGRADEPLRPLGEPPVLSQRRSWPEPLVSSEGLLAEAAALTESLCAHLAAAHLAARRIRLTLYRTDGTLIETSAGLSRPSRAPRHMMRLLAEKLGRIDAGFGIDVATLDALVVDRLDAEQSPLGQAVECEDGTALAALVDRLANRLAPARITCLAPVASHIPERAQRRRPALSFSEAATPPGGAPECGARPARPPLLLSPPEPITVMAEIPEGAPLRFTWRRVLHRVVRAEGPERIAPEWWRALDGQPSPRPRDYYRLEDDRGAGFWVFRDGLYRSTGEDGTPAWFLHGLYG